MGIFNKGAGAAVGKVSETVGKVSDNRVRREQIKDAGLAAQRRLNQTDAEHGGFYRAGWRPFLCWSVAVLFVWNHGVGDVVSQFVSSYVFRPIGDDVLDNTVWILLGLGGVRTVEKSGLLKRWRGRR